MPRPRICPIGRLLVVRAYRSVCQRDRSRQAGLSAHDAGRVPLARQVFRQGYVPRTIAMLGAVAEADLDFTRQSDHELPARRVVPVREVAGLGRPEHYALGVLQGRELRMRGGVELLDVGLAILAGVQPNHVAHAGPPRAGSPARTSAAAAAVPIVLLFD